MTRQFRCDSRLGLLAPLYRVRPLGSGGHDCAAYARAMLASEKTESAIQKFATDHYDRGIDIRYVTVSAHRASASLAH